MSRSNPIHVYGVAFNSFNELVRCFKKNSQSKAAILRQYGTIENFVETELKTHDPAQIEIELTKRRDIAKQGNVLNAVELKEVERLLVKALFSEAVKTFDLQAFNRVFNVSLTASDVSSVINKVISGLKAV